MHSLLPPPRDGSAWAEAPFARRLRIRPAQRAKTPEPDQPGAATLLDYTYLWRKPSHLTFYPVDWNTGIEIINFTHRDHSTAKTHWCSWRKCDVTTESGGHNCYMTTRIDVWFYLPDEPCQWHGTLITGDYNATFRVRRTKLCTLHTHDFGHSWGRRWDVTPAGRLADAPDIWLLNTQRKRTPQLYAVRVGPRWLAARTLADLATIRLHGLQKAA